MKTCYGGYCNEHKEGEDPGNIVLSALGSTLIDIAIIGALLTILLFI